MRPISLYPKKKQISSEEKEKPLSKISSNVVMVPLSQIKKGPPFITLFPIKTEVKNSISQDMKLNGFDNSQPVIIWKEANVLIDGHTRCAAAEEVPLSHVAVIYKSFDGVEEALRYAYGLQFKRRNLSDSDKYHFSETYLNNIGQVTKKSGWKKKELAEILSVSVGTAQKYISVISRASEKQKIAVRSGEKSINVIYNSLLNKEKEGDRNNTKKDNKKAASKKNKGLSTDLKIPIKSFQIKIEKWTDEHRQSMLSNTQYEQRILGLISILPENHPLIQFAKDKIFRSPNMEEKNDHL